MKDTQTQIDRVWGGYNPGIYNRESALKKHLEESEKSRKRQEKEATQARYDAEETRRETERQTRYLAEQTRLAEKSAEEARRHADEMACADRKTRATPETLFDLSQRRAQTAHLCHSIIAAQDTVSEQAVDNALLAIAPFLWDLFALNSAYLLDFQHKQLLKEIRAEINPLADTVRGIKLAKQVARLSKRRSEIRRFCRDLTSSAEKLGSKAILRKRNSIHAFCEELQTLPHNSQDAAVKVLLEEFRVLVNEVNASTDWQVKCDAENANAKATSKFAPLQQFTPKQLREYLGAVDRARELENKAASLAISLDLGGIPLLFLGWVVFAILVLSWIFPATVMPYVCIVPPVLYSAGLVIFTPISNALAFRSKAQAQRIVAHLSKCYPNTEPDRLRNIREEAKWNGKDWEISYANWSRMLNLDHLRICLP